MHCVNPSARRRIAIFLNALFYDSIKVIITMGRIRTQTTKRIADELIKKNPEHFTKDFQKNKQKLIEVAKVSTKKFRNIIAGYITKKIKTSQ